MLQIDIHPIQVIQDPPDETDAEQTALVRAKSTMVRVFVKPPLPRRLTNTQCLLLVDMIPAQAITADLSPGGATRVVVTPVSPADRVTGASDAFNFTIPPRRLGFDPQQQSVRLDVVLTDSTGTALAVASQNFPLRKFDSPNGDGVYRMSFIWIEATTFPLLDVNPTNQVANVERFLKHLVAVYPVPHTAVMPVVSTGIAKRFDVTVSPANAGTILDDIELMFSDLQSERTLDRIVVVTPGGITGIPGANRNNFNTDLAGTSAGGLAYPDRRRLLLIDENASSLTLAHEEGHQLQLRYSGTDTSHNNNRADDGWDVRNATTPGGRKAPPSRFLSFMNALGRTTPGWSAIADYDQLLAKLTSTGGGAGLGGIGGEPQPLLYVSGSRTTSGSLILGQWHTSEGLPDIVEPGEYAVRLLGAQDEVLVGQEFAISPAADAADGIGHFGFYIPFAAATQAVQILQGQTQLAYVPVSETPPTLSVSAAVVSEDGERVTVDIEADDADGDTLRFAVTYSPDGDNRYPVDFVWLRDDEQLEIDSRALPGSESGHVQVTVTDGVRATRATSPVFALPDRAPLVSVQQPSEDRRLHAELPVFLDALAYDAEDGFVDEANVQWSSSLDGALGEGAELTIDGLSLGTHEITVRAEDSVGQLASASVSVNVVAADAAPDLSLAELRIEGGVASVGKSLTLAARIFLSGDTTTAMLRFFAGDPAAGGTLLAEQEVELAANADVFVSQDVALATAGSVHLFAQVAPSDGEDADPSNDTASLEVMVEGSPCPGDCDGNDQVAVNELILGVNIALGKRPLESCPAFDTSADGRVAINELIVAVGSALRGCGT